MDENRLREIQERVDAATPGPWNATEDWVRGEPHFWQVEEAGLYYEGSRHENQRADAAFIAASRTDIPDLLDAVERLQTELADSDGWVSTWKARAEAIGQRFRDFLCLPREIEDPCPYCGCPPVYPIHNPQSGGTHSHPSNFPNAELRNKHE